MKKMEALGNNLGISDLMDSRLGVINFQGILAMREVMQAEGQEGKFTAELDANGLIRTAPEEIINAIVLGTVSAADFIEHFRRAPEGDAAQKIVDLMSNIEYRWLVSDPNIDMAEVLVCLQLFGGVPRSDQFMQSFAFENALYKFKLTNNKIETNLIPACIEYLKLVEFFKKKYDLKLDLDSECEISPYDEVLRISLAKDRSRIATLRDDIREMGEPSQYAASKTMQCLRDSEEIDRLSRKDLIDVINFLRLQRVSYPFLADELGLLEKTSITRIERVIKKIRDKLADLFKPLGAKTNPVASRSAPLASARPHLSHQR